jgi:hypothetical protein
MVTNLGLIWATSPWLPDLYIFKRTLPQHSLPNVTYVVPLAANYSYGTPDDEL